MMLSHVENSPATAIFAYCFSSKSMNLVDKYVVSGEEWNPNFFYIAVQICIQRSDTALVCGVY